MELQVIYFILGLILGIAITIYLYETVKEKALLNSKRFVSNNLRKALNDSSNIILQQIKELKRDLTENEKDQIIRDCYNKTEKM